jgi:hypothetical protein
VTSTCCSKFNTQVCADLCCKVTLIHKFSDLQVFPRVYLCKLMGDLHSCSAFVTSDVTGDITHHALDWLGPHFRTIPQCSPVFRTILYASGSFRTIHRHVLNILVASPTCVYILKMYKRASLKLVLLMNYRHLSNPLNRLVRHKGHLWLTSTPTRLSSTLSLSPTLKWTFILLCEWYWLTLQNDSSTTKVTHCHLSVTALVLHDLSLGTMALAESWDSMSTVWLKMLCTDSAYFRVLLQGLNNDIKAVMQESLVQKCTPCTLANLCKIKSIWVTLQVRHT